MRTWQVRTGRLDASPLASCEIFARRYGQGHLDLDGLYGGLKPLLDCLVLPSSRNPWGQGVIVDDRPSCLTWLECDQRIETSEEHACSVIHLYG